MAQFKENYSRSIDIGLSPVDFAPVVLLPYFWTSIEFRSIVST
jgi:hypothetical protein